MPEAPAELTHAPVGLNDFEDDDAVAAAVTTYPYQNDLETVNLCTPVDTMYIVHARFALCRSSSRLDFAVIFAPLLIPCTCTCSFYPLSVVQPFGLRGRGGGGQQPRWNACCRRDATGDAPSPRWSPYQTQLGLVYTATTQSTNKRVLIMVRACSTRRCKLCACRLTVTCIGGQFVVS